MAEMEGGLFAMTDALCVKGGVGLSFAASVDIQRLSFAYVGSPEMIPLLNLAH